MAKEKSKKGVIETSGGEELDNLKDKSSGPEGTAGTPGAETALMDEEVDGQKRLPGQEIPVPVEIKPLIAKVKEIEKDLKPAFARARDALITAQDKLSEIAHKNIEHFSEPDEKGSRTYKFGKAVVKITFEKEKIVTKFEDDED